MSELEFVAIIPARSGSKRIKNKNLRLLGGKPLIQWSIEAAKGSKYLDKVILSTDSGDLAAIGSCCGAEVPFLRPQELAQDDTPTIDVLTHLLKRYKEINNVTFKYVVLLQPTSPLRTAVDIDKAIELMRDNVADGVISVCETEFPIQWCNKLCTERKMDQFLSKQVRSTRSQDLDKYYRINGAVYIAKTDRLIKEKTFYLSSRTYAYEMDRQRSVDIDEELDFLIADLLMSERMKDTSATD